MSALAKQTKAVAFPPGLERAGISRARRVFYQLSSPALIEEAIRRGEGKFSASGALVCLTGEGTGRGPNDKFLVEDEKTRDIWWGEVNRPISRETFDHLWQKAVEYLAEREIFVQDLYCGADPEYRIKVRVITEQAWHALFARNMFIRPAGIPPGFEPDFTVIHVPGCRAEGEREGVNSEAFVLLDLSRGRIVIGGTAYAGEIKKSLFTVMNYLLPLRDVFPMHCSANYGESQDDCAVFFGLSGTGKTTLSSDPERTLVGDDEHGWSERGVFNFEGGCYAKVIRLDREKEPLIWQASNRFGVLLENVVMDEESREVDFDSDELTENTRSSYPIHFIKNADPDGLAGHAKHVFFLTADAFGVLPPIARLSPEQAVRYFLLGYTSKLAGTEVGVVEPQATFSTCFGAPFMVHHPRRYAELLRDRITRHGATVWLVNTGWSGGPFGVGKRIDLPYTRRMLRAALSGELSGVEFEEEPHFGLMIPKACPGVPSEVLNPRLTWQDPAAYDEQAGKLARMFEERAGAF